MIDIEGEEGAILLDLFRKEQAKKGRTGCKCTGCIADMQTAYDTFASDYRGR